MEGPGGHHATPVWPYGFKLLSRDGQLHVLNADGRSVGRIGGTFRFGGGVGSSIREGLVSPEQHQLARTRCPGDYWTVGQADLES